MRCWYWTCCLSLWLVLVGTSVVVAAEGAPGAASDRMAVFNAVHQIVADNFFDPQLQGVDWPGARAKFGPLAQRAPTREAFAEVVNQMLALLRTSHTRYLTPDVPRYYELLGVFESSGAFDRQMQGVRESLPQRRIGYVGIGIDTVATDEGTFVLSVYDGGPADEAGLLVGDRLVGVVGKPFHAIHSFAACEGQTLEVAIQRTRGGPIETVRATPRFLEGATVFRDAMRNSTRILRVGERRIGYVHVWSYAGQAYQDLLGELLQGPLAESEALVLDVRDGLGGASPAYLNLFNRDIPRLVMKSPRKSEEMVGDTQWRKPVALVINERVTSGKEVFTWGFKRMKRGPVVGHTTAGAVVAGSLFFLADHSVLYLAVADGEVDGQRLEGQGVAPTITVERPIPFSAGRDPQRDAAVESLVAELQSDPAAAEPPR